MVYNHCCTVRVVQGSSENIKKSDRRYDTHKLVTRSTQVLTDITRSGGKAAMLVYPALVPMQSYTDAESGLRTEIDSQKASDHSNIKCPLQKEQGRLAHLLCVTPE